MQTFYVVCMLKLLQLCLTLCDHVDYSPPGSSVHMDSPGWNTGMGCHALLQGIFPTLGSNPCLFMSPALAGRFFISFFLIVPSCVLVDYGIWNEINWCDFEVQILLVMWSDKNVSVWFIQYLGLECLCIKCLLWARPCSGSLGFNTE